MSCIPWRFSRPHLEMSDEFQGELRKIVDCIAILHSEDDVKNYVEQNEHDLIVLIVSMELGELMIKQIHYRKQLYKIYVYNPTNAVPHWIDDFDKVKGNDHLSLFLCLL